MTKSIEPIALFDLDGTLADFDAAMRARLERLRAPSEEPHLDETAFEEVPHIKERRRLIKSQPGFWRDLKKLPLGFEILDEVRRQHFHCHVLSKGPRKVPLAWSEKVEWCDEHVPDLPIVLAEDKGLVYGKVLVDDWPAYISRWLEWRPRGLVLAIAQPWNLGIDQQYPDNVVRYDGSNFTVVRERLAKIRASTTDEVTRRKSTLSAAVRKIHLQAEPIGTPGRECHARCGDAIDDPPDQLAVDLARVTCPRCREMDAMTTANVDAVRRFMEKSEPSHHAEPWFSQALRLYAAFCRTCLNAASRGSLAAAIEAALFTWADRTVLSPEHQATIEEWLMRGGPDFEVARALVELFAQVEAGGRPTRFVDHSSTLSTLQRRILEIWAGEMRQLNPIDSLARAIDVVLDMSSGGRILTTGEREVLETFAIGDGPRGRALRQALKVHGDEVHEQREHSEPPATKAIQVSDLSELPEVDRAVITRFEAALHGARPAPDSYETAAVAAMNRFIEVFEVPADDQKFEAGWQTFAIEVAPVAPGTTVTVHSVPDKPHSIFYVASVLEVLSLVVDDAVVLLVPLDRVEDGVREWRVHGGHVDVSAGVSITFRVKNDGAETADPRLGYVSRTHRSGRSNDHDGGQAVH